jgi:hypothetical protein
LLKIDPDSFTQQAIQANIYKVAEDYHSVALYYSTLLNQLFRGYEYSIASLAQDIADILLDEKTEDEQDTVKEDVEGEEKSKDVVMDEGKNETKEEVGPSMASQLANVFSTREFTDIPASHHVEALVPFLP